MKIYVNESRQEVRIDFGEKRYVLAELGWFTGEVIANTGPAWWSPSALRHSELVYETPEPELEWPTKPNALVEAKTPFRTQERFILLGKYWVSVEDVTEYNQEELELKRIIFEGEDTE